MKPRPEMIAIGAGDSQGTSRCALIRCEPVGTMVDRSAIFSRVAMRNAVRRRASLPLLNMRLEIEREVELAWEREIDALAAAHEPVRQRVLHQVRAEFVRRAGPGGGQSGAGRCGIDQEASRRFRSWLRAVPCPAAPVPRPCGVIGYGYGWPVLTKALRQLKWSSVVMVGRRVSGIRADALRVQFGMPPKACGAGSRASTIRQSVRLGSAWLGADQFHASSSRSATSLLAQPYRTVQ